MVGFHLVEVAAMKPMAEAIGESSVSSTNPNTVILVLHGCSLGYASFWLEEA